MKKMKKPNFYWKINLQNESLEIKIHLYKKEENHSPKGKNQILSMFNQ